MAIKGLIGAVGGPRRTRPGALTAATVALLAAALLGGCGDGGGAPALAARDGTPSKPAESTPARTMRVEKDYKDLDGNRFTVEVAVRPTDNGGRCFELGPPGGFTHTMVITVRSKTAKSKKARLPRIAARDKVVIFASKDSTGESCSTVVSTTDKTVLRGGEKKDFDAYVSRPQNRDGDLVLTVWPQGRPQEDLLRIPLRSLP